MSRTNKYFIILFFILIFSQKLFSEEKFIDQTLGYDYITLDSNSLIYHNVTGLRAGQYTYPERINLSLQQTSYNYFFGFDEFGNKKAIVLKDDNIIILY